MHKVAALVGAVFIASATVGGCAVFRPEPRVVSSTPAAVTLRYTEGDLDKATARAQELCAVHGRNAQLLQVTPSESNNRIAQYNCV